MERQAVHQRRGFLKKFVLSWLVVVLAVVAVLAVTAGGAGAKSEQAGVRVAIVTDIGGLNDRGFNSLSNVGLQRAIRQLGVQGRVFITQSASDRVPNLVAAANQGYNLIIGVGFLMYEPLNTVAPRFPNVKFAGVDVPYALLEAKPPNVRGIQFREHEAGYLVGYIAGLVVRGQAGPDVVSGIGANNVPAIVKFLAGYRAGARKANARVRVITGYANDPTFADQAKCKELALNHIQRGARIVFHAAGQCGLGAMDAAQERRVWGIGVDADQHFLGSHMLTSATKKVDVSVFNTIRDFRRSPANFRTGYDATFTAGNNGVGYGRISPRVPNRASIIRRVEAIKRQIISGKIKPPQR
jgi:basic membrane protein A and related proteins